MGRNRPHNDSYRDLSVALKRRGKRENLPCWLCGHPIDYELPWKHPMSYTYDHVVAIANGGNPRGEGRPAHRSCNSRRGARANDEQKTRPQPVEPTRSWY